MPGESACFSGNPFLQTAIPGEADDVLVKDAMLVGVETRGGHLRGHRDPDRVAHALAERAGCTLDPRGFKKLRVARRFAVQLPEALDFRHRQIVTAEVKPGVEEHAAVSGGENEIIAIDPARLVGVVSEGGAVEYRPHFGAA